MGQGLWSPWYVGNTMTDLDLKFGKDRVVDTPVSESAVTGLGVGAAIAGMKPVIVHPRMDFMLYAMDAIVNEAAKWHSMTGGRSSAGVTIRSIINRGGEQGAQHSQALHAWFMHIPGLRVVMPYSVQDARDLLIASIISPDPVMYIDDRWLYETESEISEIKEISLDNIKPSLINSGEDLTIVAAGYSVKLALEVAKILSSSKIMADVIDLRILNPLDASLIIKSVQKTGRLVVIDGGWATAGLSAEIIAATAEILSLEKFKAKPMRFTIPFAPAPSGRTLEDSYYPKSENIALEILNNLKKGR
jgi:pyruvate dehydrogenase E1 component beta subunit